MINFIHENQLKGNLRKYGYVSSDNDVVDLVNELQHKVVGDLLKQVQKVHKKVQNGGRVSFPVDYFGGQTNNLTGDIPAFTHIAPDAANLRQLMPLNDPSSALGTERAMQSVMLGGGAQSKQEKFEVSQTAAGKVVKHLIDQESVDLKNVKEFTRISKQKFEYVINDVLQKTKKFDKSQHLQTGTLEKVLKQKKYNSFKA